MQANSLMPGDSGWIEICGGEDGSYFVQSGQDGESQEPGHDCLNCSLCAATGNGATVLQASSARILELTGAKGAVFQCHKHVAIDCPEQHWSKTRGPPIEGIDQHSFSANSLFSFQLIDEISESAWANATGAS